MAKIFNKFENVVNENRIKCEKIHVIRSLVLIYYPFQKSDDNKYTINILYYTQTLR